MSAHRMPPPGRPFTDAEKLKLLSDIVKASGLPPQALLRTIVDYNVQPEWNHIPLPEGRTVNQCQVALQEMLDGYRSTDERSPQFMEPRYEPYSSAGVSPATGLPVPSYYGLPLMRPLQPRPTSYHAPPPTDPSVQPYAPVISEPPAKRRGRGRPSKAEIEADKRAAEARGEEYPPPKTSRKRTNQDLPSPLPPGYSHTGSTASSVGPEQQSAQGPYISPVEYTLSRGEQRVDPRDPNRWAETVGFTPSGGGSGSGSASATRQTFPGILPDPHRGHPQTQTQQYPNTPRIAATQQERPHSQSPSAVHRTTGTK